MTDLISFFLPHFIFELLSIFMAIINIAKLELINATDNCPAGIYLLKVNNKNTRTRCEICSKLTIKTPELRH